MPNTRKAFTRRGAARIVRRASKIRRRLAAATIALSCAAVGVVGATGAASADPQSPTTRDLGYYSRPPEVSAGDPFRKDKLTRWSFALRRDDHYLRSLHDLANDPALVVQLSNAYGVWMTRAEVDELVLRDQIGNTDQQLVKSYFAAHRDVYGGTWLDHPGGGRLVAAVTRDADLHGAALRALVRYPDRLDVRTVTHTLAELNNTQQVSRTLHEDAMQYGVDIGMVARREQVNLVEISIPAAQIEAARSFFADRLQEGTYAVTPGGDVELTGDSGVAGPPWKGATNTRNVPTTGHMYTVLCTTGFTVYRDPPKVPVRTYYMATAGHCYLNGWTIGQPTSTGNFIGTTGARCFSNCVADATLINMVQTNKSDVVVKTPGGNNFRVRFEQAQGADAVGHDACISVGDAPLRPAGDENNWYCGTLTAVSVDSDAADPRGVEPRGYWYYGRQISSSVESFSGDSGASVFKGLATNQATALGIVHARPVGTDLAIYHHIYDVRTAVSADGVARTG